MRWAFLAVAVLAVAALAAATAVAQTPNHKHYADSPDADKPGPGGELAPRLQNLGAHTFPVSTRSRKAQLFINQGMNLAYGFNHAEAGRAFREAARLDPGRFVRVHRSFVLNLDRLARVELYAKDSRVAILRDGTRLPLSRAGWARLRELL